MEPRTNQSELPFAAAEGSFQERKLLLGLALQKSECSLYEAQFMLWLFNVTDGGRGKLVKSYAELAARPWGLCCHPNQAAATVKKCERRGWISVGETRIRAGVQGPNEYGYEADGVRRYLGLAPHTTCDLPHTTCDLPHTPCDPPHTTCDPPHTPCEGIGITPFRTPESAESESESESDRPSRKSRMTSGSDPPRRAGPRSASEADWFADVPELQAAGARRIAPLPPGDLVYGPFKRLTDARLTAGALVRWFRQQLAVTRPLTGDSEAELLLVLAAGKAALALPAAEVQKNRVAVFASTVGRGLWTKVLHHVPWARHTLDGIVEQWPECLTHPTSEGPRRSELTGAASEVTR